jgi:hypothetical protein
VVEHQTDRTPDLPKRSARHLIGERAVQQLREQLPSRWIIREKSPDYGIDCEIEIVDGDSSVTGGLIFAQVKGTSNFKRKKVQVKLSSIRYWMLLPVPVIVVHVSDQVRWTDVHSYLIRHDLLDGIYTRQSKTMLLDFTDANTLPESTDVLRQLAEDHKLSVQKMRERLRHDDLALDMTCHVLVYVHKGNIDEMLLALREKASHQMLIDVYPQAYWIKTQIDADPTFLDHITRIVVREGFVEPSDELRERYA